MTADSALRQMQQACDALDQAIRSGHIARAETWLDSCPAVAADDDLAVELIYSEYISRESLGRPPAPEEYYTRFPSRANRLRRLFEVDGLLKSDIDAKSSIVESDNETTPKSLSSATTAPRMIGPYEILKKLGGGGMGVVYHACQARPKREVALKLLRSGSEAAATELARFRREAEACGRLHHSNIVPIYEIGEADGQPFLSMEYVAGGDLRKRLDGRPQSPRWSAELVRTLARAIQHAHDQGVVHRDLKPGNILLDPVAAAPHTNSHQRLAVFPKITDFGLAVMNDSDEGLTRTGQMLGTLAYLAPEQAEGKPEAMAPAVDIYALGAVLYECLVGRPPVLAESEAEALRQVVNQEPLAPRKLRPELPRDLETITMKCLQKEPAKRYATSQELADDLDRFLAGEPIRARPVGHFEMFAKWARRKPAQASLMGVSAAAIATIAFITANYTERLKTSLQEEDRHRRQAENNAREARANEEAAFANEEKARRALAAEMKRRAQARLALDQLTERLFEEGTQSHRRSAEQIASLEGALQSYEELAADNANDEASRSGAAAAAMRAGWLADRLGRTDKAEAMLDCAVSAYASLLKDFSKNDKHIRKYAEALNDRGKMRASRRIFDKAIEDFRQSLEVLQTDPSAKTEKENIQLGTTAHNLALAYRSIKQTALAADSEAKGIELWEHFLTENPESEDYRNGLARMLQNRGESKLASGDRKGARDDFQRAGELRIRNRKLTTRPFAMTEQAELHTLRAKMAVEEGDSESAAREYRSALLLRESLLAAQPGSPTHYHALFGLLGVLQQTQIDKAISASDLEAAFARQRSRYDLRASFEGTAEALLAAAGLACNHGHLLSVPLNRHDDALKAYTTASGFLDRVLKLKPDSSQAKAFLLNTRSGQAHALSGLDRHAEALKIWNEIVQGEQGSRNINFHIERARVLVKVQQPSEAFAALEAIKSIRPEMSFRRATAYAMTLDGIRDNDLQIQAEKRALEWLSKARQAGDLKRPAAQEHLRTHPDWADMRSRYTAKELIEGPGN